MGAFSNLRTEPSARDMMVSRHISALTELMGGKKVTWSRHCKAGVLDPNSGSLGTRWPSMKICIWGTSDGTLEQRYLPAVAVDTLPLALLHQKPLRWTWTVKCLLAHVQDGMSVTFCNFAHPALVVTAAPRLLCQHSWHTSAQYVDVTNKSTGWQVTFAFQKNSR